MLGALSKHARLAMWPAMVIILVGCHRITDDLASRYQDVVVSAKNEIPGMTEFCQLYPNASVSIAYFANPNYTPSVIAKVGLLQRYVLIMTVEVSLNKRRDRIATYQLPRYQLIDVATLISSHTIGEERECEIAISSHTWRQFVQNGADVRTFGIDPSTVSPVQNFRQMLKCL